MVLLAPPSVLALISNNAVPGQAAYPIKRILESGILVVASVHPTTKAMFTVQRSERRFKEVTLLIDNGNRSQNVTHTLGEFIIQTKEAAENVKKIKNREEKKQKIVELKESIGKYKVGLEAQQKKIVEAEQYLTPPSPAPTLKVEVTPTTTPKGTLPTSAVPTPTRIPGLTPQPTQIPPSPTPTPVSSVQESSCTDSNLSEAMKKALNCLDDINNRLNNVDEVPDATAADEVPPDSTAGDEAPIQELEPQPIPTKSPAPTIEPTPYEPPAVRQIRQRIVNDSPEFSDTPQKEASASP